MTTMNVRCLCLMLSGVCLFGQATTPKPYQPGDFQAANPNYPVPNPFYFEGRIDWNLLKITNPVNAWEFAQRGIYRQEDLEDVPGAIADYKSSLALNDLSNGTCQIIKVVPATNFGKITPSPCMFTVRLRLGYLLHESQPTEAIRLFQEVLLIDPLRADVNALIGETYQTMAENASNPADKTSLLNQAVAAFNAELALSPVTALSISLTGDEANNAHVHWSLAAVYEELGQVDNEHKELDLYLKATKWHSDTYPWRIELAKRKLQGN